MFAVGGIWGCSSCWFVEESSLEILSEFLDTGGIQVFFVFEVIFFFDVVVFDKKDILII